MKKKSLVLIQVIMLIYLYVPKVYAQFALVESFNFSDNTQGVVTGDASADQPLFLLRRGLLEYMPHNSPDELVVQGRYTIHLPSGATPIYLDGQYIYFHEFIRGDSRLDEPGKYIDGHSVLSKYRISGDGQLSLIDSVGTAPSDMAIFLEGKLPSIPIIITVPMAVDGGGCNSGYSVYDENLKKTTVIKPDLENCGTGTQVFVEDNKVHLLDQDVVNPNIVSWCSADLRMKKIERTHFNVDKEFIIYNKMIDNGILYISGWKKTEGTPKSYDLLVYGMGGKLLRRINTQGQAVSDVHKLRDGRSFIGDSTSNIKVLDANQKEVASFSLPGPKKLLAEKVLVYQTNKILVYEGN